MLGDASNQSMALEATIFNITTQITTQTNMTLSVASHLTGHHVVEWQCLIQTTTQTDMSLSVASHLTGHQVVQWQLFNSDNHSERYGTICCLPLDWSSSSSVAIV